MREETLVRNLLQHQRVIRALITVLVGDPGAVEDLFQDLALLMTRKRESADEDCKFVAWARRMAVNLVRDHRKRLARRRTQPLDDETLESVARTFEETGESVWESRREALRQCAERLPDRDRGVLRRRYEEGIPAGQIADEFSMKRGAVDTLLYRLRKSLHQCVDGKLQHREDS